MRPPKTNIIQDPEAADRVFHSGADVTMVGLDVTHQCLLGSDATVQWRQAASQSQDGDVRTFLADIADFPSRPISPQTPDYSQPACHCTIRSPQP